MKNFMKKIMRGDIKNISSILTLILMIIIFIAPFSIIAQDAKVTTPSPDATVTTPSPINIEIKNPFKQDTIEGLIETIVNDILIPIGGVVAVMMIIYAGFMYVTARGDPGKIKTAHDALLWAVIGAAILLGARVISEAIQETIDQLRT
ncbi:MAG: pilin [Patescibacteria group bacterium]